MNELFIFFIGLAVGSFLNVILYRTRENQGFLAGHSFCPSCKKQISWYDNIPLLSFIFLAGRCRHCGKRISLQYPLVELAVGLIFLGLYLKFGLDLKFLSLALFCCFLVLIFVYDFKYYLILDRFTIPPMVIALLINPILGVSLQDLFLGFLLGAGFFVAQYVLSSGRWIGSGDIRLGALMGSMLGGKMLLVALFLAYITGAVVAIFLLIAKRKKLSSKIPFGTFLSAATMIAFFYGPEILDWYMNLTFYR